MEDWALTGTWPLVGRGDLLEHLDQALHSSSGGLLLVGPAGVGKTRLLRELARCKLDSSSSTISITGAEASSAIPLAPLLRLIDLNSVGDLAHLVLREVARLAHLGPLIVTVDDAHALDDASAALLHQVVATGLAKLVLAVRTPERVPASLWSLWKDGAIERVQIGALSEADTDDLVHALLGTACDETRGWLWRYSQGHPLYLRALLLDLADRKLLSTVEGRVELKKGDHVPEHMLDLIGTPSGLAAHQHTAAIALVGLAQPVSEELFASVFTPTVLEQLTTSGAVDLDESGELVLAHPLYGESALARMTSTARTNLLTQVGHALADTPGREIDAAVLLLDAGLQPDPMLIATAARTALHFRQITLAQRLIAVELKTQPGAKASAHWAALLAMQADWSGADDWYRTAVEESDPGPTRGQIWLEWIQSTFEYRQDSTAARELAARAMVTLDNPYRERALAWHLRARMFTEPMGPVLKDLLAACALGVEDAVARRIIDLDVASCSWQLCQPLRGLEYARRSGALDDEDIVFRSRAMQVHAALLALGESIDSAEVVTSDLVAFALETADPDVALHAQAARILLHARAGRAAEVVAGHRELERLSSRAMASRWVEIFIAELAFAQTELPDAAVYVPGTLGLMTDSPELAAHSLILLTRSRIERSSNPALATETVQEACRAARANNFAVYEMLCLREIAYLEEPTTEVVARARELAVLAGPGLAQLFAREIAALSNDDADELARVSQAALTYGAIGFSLTSTIAAQHCYRQRGRRASAFATELAASQIAADLPNQQAYLAPQMTPRLTSREREVVEHITTGATNRQIADELFLSPSTVKRHLERIYIKLKIGDRKTLGALAADGTAHELLARAVRA